MRLTVHTDYSLRLLIYLGLHDGQLVTVNEIAGFYGISKNHLMKVSQHLSTGGFLQTVRGKNGGLRLATAPDQITVGAVVRHMEADWALVGCFDAMAHECRITTACILRSTLQRALHAFMAELDAQTLQDLLAARPLLQELLAAPLPVAISEVA